MSKVESQGFPNTGRRTTSASRSASGASAPRRVCVLSGSVANFRASTRNGRELGDYSRSEALLPCPDQLTDVLSPIARVRRVRIAVLADIHGNLPALRAVLAEIDRDPVDAIVVAGDVEREGAGRSLAG